MFVSFDTMSPSSRIWIYQGERKFTANEYANIVSHLRSFTETWAAHGQALKASFDIRYDQFIVLAADESYNTPSGCSIDESVRFIKALQQQTGVDFFNRNLIAFKTSHGITLVTVQELKQKYTAGIWHETTPTFNNLITVKNQLETDWIVPAGKTWLKRYVPVLNTAS